ELASSWLVLGARVVDRFGDNGLVGALAIERDAAGGWSIENFVLSCRVFSRNVEDAILGLVLQAARERGARSVRGRFVETSKNKKFARFYEQQGFGPSADESAPFEHDLLSVRALPAWVHVSRGLEAFHAF
ncbi:MAG: FkbH like protein, partial [Myxococcaceae bacterium]|nr:FkbH like protein [Myxococcaceae bacterium]